MLANKMASEFKSRSGLWGILPELLVIIGRDTTHRKGEHPYWDARGLLEATPNEVASIRTVAQSISPVDVVFVAIEELEPHLNPSWWLAAKAAWAISFPTKPFPQKLGVIAHGGRQRTIAARAANIQAAEEGNPLMELPALHHAAVDGVRGFGLRIAENAMRKALTPLEIADEIKVYEENFSADDARILTYFAGLVPDERRLEWFRSLQYLCPEVREAIVAGTVKVGRAQKWAIFPDKMQREELDKWLHPVAEPTNGATAEPPKPRGPKVMTPSGTAPARAALRRLYKSAVEGKLPGFPIAAMEALGWACGDLRGSDTPRFITDALSGAPAEDVPWVH